MTRVAIGLGSNLGDRLEHLRRGRDAIAALAPVRAQSGVWETAPVGGPEQGPFLNAAIVIDWAGPLDALLARLLEIERAEGRARRERWGPRTLDLDVLLAEDAVVDQPGLVVPHPRLAERAFALAPLLEAWPDARHPITRARYDALVVDRATVARTTLSLER